MDKEEACLPREIPDTRRLRPLSRKDETLFKRTFKRRAGMSRHVFNQKDDYGNYVREKRDIRRKLELKSPGGGWENGIRALEDGR